MSRYPEPYYASNRTYSYVQAEPRWHGLGMVCGPSTSDRPGGWTEEHVQCEHFHLTIDAAKECGDKLAASAVRKLNREARDTNVTTPCEIAAANIASFSNHDPMWLKHCRSHRTSATLIKSTEAEALAVEWDCPWAEHVKNLEV